MKKIVCFGELLLRYSPFEGSFEQNYMPVYIGGAELNVATALAIWGVPVDYISAAPDNYLSREILNNINKRGVDTAGFLFGGNRIGIYYLQQGTDLKHAGVIYDRAGSSFAEIKPGTTNWDSILENASWFHFSAISPALSENAARICEEVLQVAKRKNIPISVDLNHRAKLWQYGKKPGDVMPDLVKYCDVIMGNLWAAEVMLGIPVPEITQGEIRIGEYTKLAEASSKMIMDRFPMCKAVANTFRFDKNDGIHYFATYHQKGSTIASKEFLSEKIIDKVGSGDCFMAGLIYGIDHKRPAEEIINFAAAAAFGKMHEKGDSTRNSVADINKILSANE